MSTELPDLYEEPTERLSVVFNTFIKKLNTTHEAQEEDLDAQYVRCRSKLYNLHKKTIAVYEDIHKNMLRALNEDRNAKDAMFFEKYIRSENKHYYHNLFDCALPEIKKAEENHTHIEFCIKETTGSYSYRDCGLGYFDDGWDPDTLSGEYGTGYTYDVVRRRKTAEELEFDCQMRKNGFVVIHGSKGKSMSDTINEYLPVSSETVDLIIENRPCQPILEPQPINTQAENFHLPLGSPLDL